MRENAAGSRLCAVLACIVALLCGGASEPAERRERTPSIEDLAPEVRNVLERLDEANARLEDVTARVTYERTIPLLDAREKCRGKLEFRKPDRISLELGKPRNEEVHADGKQWWVVSHNERQVEVYEAAEGEGGGSEAAFLDFGYGRGADKLVEDYSVELLETRPGDDKAPTVYRLRFVPRERPDRPARYAAIEVEIADDLWLPHVLELHEAEGEMIHTYTLSRVRTNTGLEDKDFEYKPPAGYRVLRPQEP